MERLHHVMASVNNLASVLKDAQDPKRLGFQNTAEWPEEEVG